MENNGSIKSAKSVPYRIFSDTEIKEWLKEDRLTPKIDKRHLLRPDIKKYFKPLKIITPGELLEIFV